jgi:hypothetical protein
MGDVGGGKHLSSPGWQQLGTAGVDVGGSVQANAGVAVLVVVSAEEPAAEGVRVLVGAEAVGELGPVLHGVELALAVGVDAPIDVKRPQ